MATQPSDELSAAATHDIANALVTVLGWARLVREGAVSPDEAMAAIETAAKAAHRTALDALGDPQETGPTELSALADDLVRLLAPQARERGVKLSATADRETWVRCPRTQAFRVAWNLVLNAIQIVPSGGRVSIEVVDGGFVVADDGPGMDRGTQLRVLGEGGHSTRRDGRGIGLVSVRRLLAEHGGTLRLDTAPGRGARFRVELPEDDAPEPSAVSEARPRSAATSHVHARAVILRVLVVDDDDGVRDLLATTLRLRGLDVHAVRAASDVDHLHEPFDVALVDLTLGDVSGLDVVATLRARALATRVIAMSGLPQLPETEPEHAPDRWLRKPFDATQLFDVLGLDLEPFLANG